MLSIVLVLLPIFLAACFMHAIVFHKSTRQKLETTCVKESHLRTFMNNFVANLLIALPVVLALFVAAILAEAIL